MTVPILLLHGLWSRGPEEQLLRRRVSRYTGRPVERFGYHSMRQDFAVNVRALVERLGRLDAEYVDLISHSLGGLVALAALRAAPGDRVRRAVLLGPPVGGSVSARRLARFGPLGRAILGRCGETLMTGVDGPVPGPARIGIIAGDRPIGMGRLLGPMQGPGDGTVLVAETHLPGAAAHLVLPVSHTGLLFSDAVARAACRFLTTGRFDASARSG